MLKEGILEQAGKWLDREPVTVTDFVAERSAGGIHDFYSEGDYWWPDPENPDGPYIRRDGESNPDNFSEHRKAMIDFSMAVGSLASAYLLTGRQEYADAVGKHVRAWFIDEQTRMNPSLLYAQAIKGRVTGRGIGIIDTMKDLMVNFVGAIVFSVIGYFGVKYRDRRSRVNKIADDLIVRTLSDDEMLEQQQIIEAKQAERKKDHK